MFRETFTLLITNIPKSTIRGHGKIITQVQVQSFQVEHLVQIFRVEHLVQSFQVEHLVQVFKLNTCTEA